jgi:hypothetical protein
VKGHRGLESGMLIDWVCALQNLTVKRRGMAGTEYAFEGTMACLLDVRMRLSTSSALNPSKISMSYDWHSFGCRPQQGNAAGFVLDGRGPFEKGRVCVRLQKKAAPTFVRPKSV